MELYLTLIISISLFLIGLLIGSLLTFFILKNIQKKQTESMTEAYSSIYEKMQLQFENLSNKIFKETTQDFSNLSKERMNEKH